ncbi:MAG: hypothetical protein JSR53_14595 [Proteobacteria bacterium]|nr:hypothetical protein [Pseudomonadota bacterium]
MQKAPKAIENIAFGAFLAARRRKLYPMRYTRSERTVMPAQAGIQPLRGAMDSRLRGNDDARKNEPAIWQRFTSW